MPPGENSAFCIPVFGSTLLCTAYVDLEVLVLMVNRTSERSSGVCLSLVAPFVVLPVPLWAGWGMLAH